MPEFRGFPKIGRFSKECILTEKIDGTNAQVLIKPHEEDDLWDGNLIGIVDGYSIFAGSRTRWINLKNDNAGFARWVHDNLETVAKLGEGQHFGEFWGFKIGRGYGLPKGDKRFSLFNVSRWTPENTPEGIYTVPILATGDFNDVNHFVDVAVNLLNTQGSQAAPGFDRPEGIVVFHESGALFKKFLTVKEDYIPKGKQ